MSSPNLAKNAVLWDGSQAIGYCKEVTWSIEVDAIKDYKVDSYDPAILEPGQRTYKVTFRRFYIDKTYADKVSAGTKFTTLEVRPLGTGTGKEKYTFSNVVLLRFEGSWAAGGVVYERVDGEASGLTIGTQT